MKNKKVYICTSGEYSDYHIVSVFTKKENANFFKKKFSGKYKKINIEEWELNSNIPQDLIHNDIYFVIIKKDGSIVDCYKDNDDFSLKQINKVDWNTNLDMYTHCLSNSKEHAIKIANERRTAMILANKWPDKFEIRNSVKV